MRPPSERAPTDRRSEEVSSWVSLGSAGSVKRIDPGPARSPRSRLGLTPIASPWQMEPVGERARAGSAHRGGTLTVVAPRDLLDEDSIDPALAYNSLTWSILALTNDGLVGFRRVGGVDGTAMVQDLASSSRTRPMVGARTGSSFVPGSCTPRRPGQAGGLPTVDRAGLHVGIKGQLLLRLDRRRRRLPAPGTVRSLRRDRDR